jgi:hypothetical protein
VLALLCVGFLASRRKSHAPSLSWSASGRICTATPSRRFCLRELLDKVSFPDRPSRAQHGRPPLRSSSKLSNIFRSNDRADFPPGALYPPAARFESNELGQYRKRRNPLTIAGRAVQLREAVQISVQRDRPFGSVGWQAMTAKKLGFESTFQHHGRPGKKT